MGVEFITQVDDIYVAPERPKSDEPLKRTFTKSSDAYRKLMSPRPKPALNLGSTKKLTSHYAAAESKLKSSGLIRSVKLAPMGSLIPTPLKRPSFKAPLKKEKAAGVPVTPAPALAVASPPTRGMTKEEIDAEIAKLGDDDLVDAHGDGPKQQYSSHEAEMAQADLGNIDAALDAMIEADFADDQVAQDEIKVIKMSLASEDRSPPVDDSAVYGRTARTSAQEDEAFETHARANSEAVLPDWMNDDDDDDDDGSDYDLADA